MTPENLPGLRITADQVGAIWTPISVPPRPSLLDPQAQRPPTGESTIKVAA